MITLPLPVRAKFVILGIVSYNENPCLKFELMGCPVDPSEQIFLGFDNGFPLCVDNEPPAFINCPGVNVIKLVFCSSLAKRPNKLKCLPVASLSRLV
jgi:hypothetical protein